MDIIDQSFVFVIILLGGMLIGLAPSNDWWKVVVFTIYVINPAWYAWATGLWPFYIMSVVLTLVFIVVVSYSMGKALNDAKD